MPNFLFFFKLKKSILVVGLFLLFGVGAATTFKFILKSVQISQSFEGNEVSEDLNDLGDFVIQFKTEISNENAAYAFKEFIVKKKITQKNPFFFVLNFKEISTLPPRINNV